MATLGPINLVLSPARGTIPPRRSALNSPPSAAPSLSIVTDNEENGPVDEKSNGANMLSASISPTSPNGSPSMTQRRGINLRIHVIPPDDTSSESETETETYRNEYGSGNWSPPLSRPHSSLEGNNNMRYLTLPPNPEMSPSYYASPKSPAPQRRHSAHSACSCCNECCGAFTGMSLSPSSLSLSSSISFITALDGNVSPYCLSPTMSRSPSTIGWRSRAYVCKYFGGEGGRIKCFPFFLFLKEG